jgi:uncharacterized protein with HEPN domain
MTAGRDDTLFLQHILDGIGKIEKYIRGIDEEKFMADSLIQDGVIRQLEIIGEAVKNLSSELRDQNNHLPWKDMAGMRDKLIHRYFGVDLQALWLTATADIPKVKREIRKILRWDSSLRSE